MAMQQFSQSLPMMLYRALDAVMPRFRLIFNEFGLTEQQWRVLRVLWEHDRIRFAELADHTLIPPPSLVGVVDRLLAAKLVVRERSQQDRRQVFVRATRAGKKLEARVMPRVQAAYEELRGLVNEDVWSHLLLGLEKVSHIEQPDPVKKTGS